MLDSRRKRVMRMTLIKAALAAGGLVLSLLQPALAADKQKFFFMFFQTR